MTRGLLYIAAPYTAHPTHYTRRVLRAAWAIHQYTDWTPIVPHLTHFWDAICPRPRQSWLDYDLAILSRCDAITRAPEPSEGADAEIAAARDHELLVVIDWLTLPEPVHNAYNPAPGEYRAC